MNEQIPEWLSQRIGELVRQDIYDTVRFRSYEVLNIMEGRGCTCRNCTNSAVTKYNQAIVFAFADDPDKMVDYLMRINDEGRIVKAIDCVDENGWIPNDDEDLTIGGGGHGTDLY